MIGELLDNLITVTCKLGNLGLGWLDQKADEWSNDLLTPEQGKTKGDELKDAHKGGQVSEEAKPE